MSGADCWTYLLRCRDGSLYAGWTVDVQARLKVHNSGRGSRYVNSRRPAVLAASWRWPDKTLAMSAEATIKRLSRAQKEALITGELQLLASGGHVVVAAGNVRPNH